MKGQWISVPVKDGKASFSYIPPKPLQRGCYNGFQSRWVINGRKFLSPIQLTPSLMEKLEGFAIVQQALSQLPPEKRTVENIENRNLRNGILELENLIPMNTWDVQIDVRHIPGRYIEGEHRMSAKEKAMFIADKKFQDPSKYCGVCVCDSSGERERERERDCEVFLSLSLSLLLSLSLSLSQLSFCSPL